MNDQQEREAFEAWYEGNALPGEADWFRRDSMGEYQWSDTAACWEGWQARAALAAKAELEELVRAGWVLVEEAPAPEATPAPAPTDEQIKARFESRWGEHGWRAVGAYYAVGFRDGAALAATPAPAPLTRERIKTLWMTGTQDDDLVYSFAKAIESEIRQQTHTPLTEEELRMLDNATHFHESPDWSIRFARAIERAHGIKEQP